MEKVKKTELNDMEKLDEILLTLGHDDRVLGTQMLREAVRLYFPGCAMGWLYEAVGEKAGKPVTAVERDMRYSLEKAWQKTDYHTAVEYFGSSWDAERGRPTLGEYVARLDRLTR